jgi:hypothetical protein
VLEFECHLRFPLTSNKISEAIDTDSTMGLIHPYMYTATALNLHISGNHQQRAPTLTSQTVHPFQSLPPHWSQCLLLHPPFPPPGVLVGGLCVEEGRFGGGREGRIVVDGLEGVAGREELGVGIVGGFEGLGGRVPPRVGVLT